MSRPKDGGADVSGLPTLDPVGRHPNPFMDPKPKRSYARWYLAAGIAVVAVVAVPVALVVASGGSKAGPNVAKRAVSAPRIPENVPPVDEAAVKTPTALFRQFISLALTYDNPRNAAASYQYFSDNQKFDLTEPAWLQLEAKMAPFMREGKPLPALRH